MAKKKFCKTPSPRQTQCRKVRLGGEEKTLKDTAVLKRLNDISALPDKDREHILYTIDGLIRSTKLQAL